ncbi:MAG TPA: hypothetical protein EYG38_07490, partial [Verrucomicrobia bacterium]|nr:hypothetical protein [Verrucomicrobiota bacterium]
EIGADLVNGFTIAAWFRSNVDLDAGGAGNRMLEKGNAYFFLQGVQSGGMNFLVKQNGSNKTANIGESLSANVWYHITGVFDGSDAHVYIDGELKESQAVGGPVDDANLPLRIGSDDSGNFFNGAMDQVVIWNRPLNSEEVIAVVNNEFDAVATDPPVIVVDPVSQSLYESSTIVLSVDASGPRPFRYLWSKDGEAIRSATESTLSIGDVTVADAGSYTVRVSNASGDAVSNAAVVEILPVTSIDSGRLAYWSFDASSGTTAADGSGNGNDGNLSNFGGSQWVAGQVNNALEFDSFSTVVTVDDSASINEIGPDATIAFWMNLNTYGLEQDVGNYTRSATYVIRKGDHLSVRVMNDPGTITRTIAVRGGVGGDGGGVARNGWEVNATQGTTELNVWQHWTIVYKGGLISFYLNGIPVGEPVEGSLGEVEFEPLFIGAFDDQATAERNLDGLLDELSIWDRPIREAEILELAGKDIVGAPAIELQPAGAKKLEGTSVSFQVVATGKRPVTYQWMRNGAAIEGANGRILTLKGLKGSNAGNYTVTINNELGETTSESAELLVEALGAITSGLVAYFSFDDESGDTIADSSGNDLNGTRVNFDGLGHQPGVIGGSLWFDGVDDFAEIAHDPLLNLTTEATISVWLNPVLFSGGSDFDRVIRKDVTYDFVLINGGVARVHGINKTPYSSPGGTVEAEIWQHFAYVVRNNTIQWYKNGVEVGGAVTGQLGGLNTMPLVLGNYEIQDDNWINRPYQGGMDDLGIWQRALTPTELDGIYQNGLQGKPLTEEFEPLNIRSVEADGDIITLTYYNPFPSREVIVQSNTALVTGSWTDQSNVTTQDLGDSLFTATITVNGSPFFYRVGAVPPPPIYFDDFETGGSGWTHSGNGDNWELGSPTTGPGQAFSGTNVYATGLSSNFATFADTFLISPVIDLTDFNQASLAFWEFRNMDPPAGDLFFHGAEVSVLDADTMGVLQILSTEGGTTNGWEQRTNRLGIDSLGRRIRLQFHFFADDFNLSEGWFIDDVAIVAE